MGQQRARDRRLRDAASHIAEHERQYQYALRALVRALPDPSASPVNHVAVFGQTDIWPCLDAAVALVRKDSRIEVRVKSSVTNSVQDFFRYSPECAWHDENAVDTGIRSVIEPGDHNWLPRYLHMVGGTIKKPVLVDDVQTSILVGQPRYDRASIYGWQAVLPAPDEEALTDFRFAYVSKNVVVEPPADLGKEDRRRLTVDAAENLADDFVRLLASAKSEQELHVFLLSHPQLLYPDYIECLSKFRLGSEFVTDYVFVVQGTQGLEHVFVEIENSAKDVTTTGGQFSASFTQAKNQLLEWQVWVQRNHAYLRETLPNFHRPYFHLIMGRSTGIDERTRDKLRYEFDGTTTRFSTYDDLTARFRKIVENVLPQSGQVDVFRGIR